jgi:hypothetical protein
MPVYKGTVYRSVSNQIMKDERDFESQLRVGTIYWDSAFMSTSCDKPYDESFKYQFVIKSKTGRDMRKYNPDEREILFKRKTLFFIIKREGNTI